MPNPMDSPEAESPATIEVTVSLPGSERTEPAEDEREERSILYETTHERISATSLPPAEMASLSELIGAKRYSVLGRVGVGGMATVYVARDEFLLRNVAVKVQRGDAEAAGARFLEEAQVLGQLEHPNIVPLYTLETASDGTAFSTMRYLRGHSLHHVLQSLSARNAAIQSEYSLTRLMQIFQQITQAVSYAHNQGVIHRDLKPANVMLGEHGEVQVVDWGIAKVRAESGVQTDSQRGLTMPGQVVGTPAYMAPEQWAGAVVDERADIYSLGVILYELLTLRRPFDGDNPLVLCRNVLTVPPPPLRTATSDRSIPLELEQACLKALGKVPEARQQQVLELYRSVQNWLETETDKARRHALAEEKVDEARRLLRAYQLERERLVVLEREAREAAGAFKTWQSVGEKRALYAAEERVQGASRQLIDI
jgi:serine/threonine protein kinase